MKGIILAGGSGSRLYPLTLAITKQLLPVYDKPMIYYPLSILMSIGIREICIISTKEDLPRFEHVLGDGSSLGINIIYLIQPKPEGIAQSLIIAETFIANSNVALILGDNIFYGYNLATLLLETKERFEGAAVFGYKIKNPSRYGVIDFDEQNRPKAIIEKPKDPPSDYAVTGLYFYDNNAVSYAKQLKPSNRKELEITDLNQIYLDKGKLDVTLFDSGFAWLDMGTHEALHQAASFVQTIQDRQGIQIASIEEIAYNQGWITLDAISALADKLKASSYGEYLSKIVLKEKKRLFIPNNTLACH
ncbi:MAG: glucose-1-phosphate thymidylyltransferase RfbA [Chlamydiales bacterium]|nr:glucose-1-phosphate thymidylyltransferase RfbA [Chlamydiales bacterium]